jgi:hypothetical protein
LHFTIWRFQLTAGAPSRRFNHTAVWAGSAMVVWGGFSNSALDTGGVYTLTSTLGLSPTSQSFMASGGSGSVSVTVPGSCTWTARSNAAWLTITSGGSGTSNGTVNYSVAANTSGNSRTGILRIGPQTLTVTQAGQ